MPSTYTTTDRVEKQAAGENNNTWGTKLNENTTDMLVEAMNGVASYALSGTKTLSTANGTTDEARCGIQLISSGSGGTVTIPNVKKHYFVINAASGSVIFTTGSGTTATVPAGCYGTMACVGGNVCYFWGGPNFGAANLLTTGTLGAGAATLAATIVTTLTASGAIAGASSIKSSSATAGVGYATGAGGTGVQASSNVATVTVNKVCGTVTTFGGAVINGATVSFTVSNNTVAATDTIKLCLASGHANAKTYEYRIDGIGSGTFVITYKNISAGTLSENLVFNFTVEKSVTS